MQFIHDLEEVVVFLHQFDKSTDKLVENARKMAEQEFNLNKGDLIIITGGFPIGESKRTNYLRIMEI